MYGNRFYNPQGYHPIDNLNNQFNNQYMQTMQQINTQVGLLGKSVDSIEVVKAMDIPLDGSTSYFPLTDGSAIVTKRLMSDGTSRTMIYKPVNETKETGFLVMDDLADILNDIDDMKKQLQDLKQKVKED